jgi:hypothetical protein
MKAQIMIDYSRTNKNELDKREKNLRARKEKI